MKHLLLLLLLSSFACARKDNECKSRESMQYECEVVNTPQYGRPYAQEQCKRSYSANKCY